jgi:type I restriction enzyme, S subunit
MSAPLREGYKQTEVGVIPEDWESGTIKSLAASVSNAIVGGPFGSDLVSRDYVDDGVPVIRGQNMGRRWLKGPYVFVTDKKAASLEANLARPGDVLFTQRGTLGQVSIVPDIPFRRYLVSQSQMKVTLNNKIADSKFLLCWFVSERGQESIRLNTIQTGVPHINLGILRGLTVPIPPIREQEAIAGALNDVDALIESLEQLIIKKRHLKQGSMQDLLTGKNRLPGFSKDWELIQLEELAIFHKGRGLPKSMLNISGSELCIHYGELFTRYPETIQEVISRTNVSENSFRSVSNDVLMPTSDVTPNGLAKASCIKINDVILGGDILIIRSSKDRVLGSFLSYVIRYAEKQVLQLVTGSTVFHLYAADIKKFTFFLPSVAEQQAIITILDEQTAEISNLELQLTKAKFIKQGMMNELLTGKIRLI